MKRTRCRGNYENDYGELFLNYLPFQSLPYKLLWLTEGDITLNRYEWKDEVEILVNPKMNTTPLSSSTNGTGKWWRNYIPAVPP